MVKKLNILIILLMFTSVLFGCKEFYTFNLFDGLDYVKTPNAEDLNDKPVDENLEYLKESISSESFIEKIAENEESLKDVEQYLEDVYTGTIPATEEQQVTAAVLAADLQLGVNGSDELIDNIFNALTAIQGMSGGSDPEAAQDAIQQILEGIMPDSIVEETDPEAQKEAFTGIITGLLAAADIYETLGDTILTDPAAGSSDITGGTVVNAAVAGMVDLVVTQLVDPEYQDTPEEAAAVLWNLYEVSLNEGNPAAVPGFNESAEMTSDITDLTYLENIALASGFDLASVFGAE